MNEAIPNPTIAIILVNHNVAFWSLLKNMKFNSLFGKMDIIFLSRSFVHLYNLIVFLGLRNEMLNMYSK